MQEVYEKRLLVETINKSPKIYAYVNTVVNELGSKTLPVAIDINKKDHHWYKEIITTCTCIYERVHSQCMEAEKAYK